LVGAYSRHTFLGSAVGHVHLFFVLLATQVVLGMIIALLLDCDAPGFGIARRLLTLTLIIPPPSQG